MQTAKMCFIIIKEWSKQEFKWWTLLCEAVAFYFTSNVLRRMINDYEDGIDRKAK